MTIERACDNVAAKIAAKLLLRSVTCRTLWENLNATERLSEFPILPALTCVSDTYALGKRGEHDVDAVEKGIERIVFGVRSGKMFGIPGFLLVRG